MRRGWLALVALVAAGCGALSAASTGPGHSARGDGIRYDDASRGLHLVHPSAWRVYSQKLTDAISGRDQIALGTFPLHQKAPDPNCAPATALRSRPPDGGLIYMYETEGLNRTQLERIPARPARLALPRSSYQPYECMGLSWRVDFRDGGRAFTAHVYGPPARRREALAILDSLRVRPAPFRARLHAAHFPQAPRWRTRISEPSPTSPRLRQAAGLLGLDRPIPRRPTPAPAKQDDRSAAA